MLKKIFSGIALVLIAAISFSCKEKGCMDKDSLNYNSMAEEDDGSCVYCDSISTFISSRSLYLIDDFSASTHYLEQIARFDLTQHKDTFNFVQCGQNGCKISLVITNLINQSMDIQYYLRLYSPINLYASDYVNIPAGSSVNMGVISTLNTDFCPPITSATWSLELQNPATYY